MYILEPVNASRQTDSQNTSALLALIIDPIPQQVIQCHLPGMGIQLSLLVTIPRLNNDVCPANEQSHTAQQTS